MHASVPYSLLPHVSWATPGPSVPDVAIRIHGTLLPSRTGLAASVHANWRCGDGSGGRGALG